MARQTLIHLHGTTQLTDATKLNLGEIAVRNAATKAETELAVLTSAGDALVYIPSLDKVTGLTNTISNSIDAIVSRVGDNEKDIEELQVAIGISVGSGETLTSRVETLETLVGDSTDGLVKDVADNTAAISANTTAITTNTAAISAYGTKIGNLESSAHTHTNKDVIDGITSEKVNAWNNAESNAIASAKSYTDSAITTTTTSLGGQISAAQTTADNNTRAITGLTELVGGIAVATQISNAIEGLDASKTGSSTHITVKVDQLNGVITGVTVNENGLATSGDLSALQTKVNTLVGSDENKSARAIAAEEVAQVVADAPEDFDTLKEIAAWITSDKTSSAQMVSDIDNLKKVTSGYTTQSSIQNAITAAQTTADNNTRAITGLTELVGDTAVATQIRTAIEGLDATAGTATITTGKHVAVQVIEQDGKVTTVNVVENDIASANALSAVESTANSAAQTVTVSNLTGVSANKTGTAVAIDFSNMIINCGEYE